MPNIRCINSVKEQVNPRGLRQIVTEFSHKDGTSGTEIITMFDDMGTSGIRTIKRDVFGIPSRVIDKVYGRTEEYVSAFPEYNEGVFQYSEGMVRSYFPNINFVDLCKY